MSKKPVLSKFMILGWATFIAILGRGWDAPLTRPQKLPTKHSVLGGVCTQQSPEPMCLLGTTPLPSWTASLSVAPLGE